MDRARILSSMAICSVALVAACSASSTEDLPTWTTDPSANPSYYDTQIVNVDKDGKTTVVWQHTTPERYAEEVAAHTGHPIARTNPSGSTVGEVTGATSSAIAQDTGCANTSTWLYNYDRHTGYQGNSCDIPTYYGEARICFSGAGDAYLNDYAVYGGTWKNAVAMFWPGSQAGSLGYWSLILYQGHWTPFWWGQDFSANASCTSSDPGVTFREDLRLY